jgi:hypothetical protein
MRGRSASRKYASTPATATFARRETALPDLDARFVQMSWAPDGAGEDSPWMRMFRNARVWVA